MELPPPFDLVPLLMRGAGVTIILTLGGAIVALAVAFTAGLARLSPVRPVSWSAAAFVELFRGTSLLVQLFMLFYLLPLYGVRLEPVQTAIVGLGLNFGAYGSEIVRGAILSVHRGQWDASIALNMPRSLALRRVIIPQALVAMLPSFANSLVELLKGTSLVSLITISELAFTGRVLVQNTNRPAEVFTLVLVIYFVMAYPLTRIVKRLEVRAGRGLSLGRGEA